MKTAWLALVALWMPAVAVSQGLYDEQTFQAYAEDRRARNVGDALTVLVVEVSQAETEANTSANSEVSVSVGIREPDVVDDFGVRGDRTSSGGGSVRRSGRLRAQLAVEVVEVFPNGELGVSGTQRIVVNDEEQYLSVSGRVRPGDIGADNSVLSTRLVNADIAYIGEGVLGKSQRPGIIYRFFNWLGLF